MKIGVQQFFNLPMEEKKKFWQTPEDMQGFGQLFVVSEEQKLEWADMFYVNTFPLSARHPHLIPSIPQPFRFLSSSLPLYVLYLQYHWLIMLVIKTDSVSLQGSSRDLLFRAEKHLYRIHWPYGESS